MSSQATSANLLTLIEIGFIFAATSSWSNTLNAGVELVYPNSKREEFRVKLVYSVILTLFVVFLFYSIEALRARAELELARLKARSELELARLWSSARSSR